MTPTPNNKEREAEQDRPGDIKCGTFNRSKKLVLVNRIIKAANLKLVRGRISINAIAIADLIESDRRQFAERVLAAGPQDFSDDFPAEALPKDLQKASNKVNEMWRAAIASQLSGGEGQE